MHSWPSVLWLSASWLLKKRLRVVVAIFNQLCLQLLEIFLKIACVGARRQTVIEQLLQILNLRLYRVASQPLGRDVLGVGETVGGRVNGDLYVGGLFHHDNYVFSLIKKFIMESETVAKVKRQLTPAQQANWEKARAARMANIEKRKAEAEEAKQERKAKMKQYRQLAKDFMNQEEQEESPAEPPPTSAPAPSYPEIDYNMLADRLAETLESRMPVMVETAPDPEPPKPPAKKRAPRRPKPASVVPAPAPHVAPQPQRYYAPRLHFY